MLTTILILLFGVSYSQEARPTSSGAFADPNLDSQYAGAETQEMVKAMQDYLDAASAD